MLSASRSQVGCGVRSVCVGYACVYEAVLVSGVIHAHCGVRDWSEIGTLVGGAIRCVT